MDAETVETGVWTVEEEINDPEDSVGETEENLSEEHQAIVKQLKKIIVEGRTGDGIVFKKVDKKVLEVQTDSVNEAIKYLKSKSITETNNLIRAASVWVVERIGLKKAEHRKKNQPRWKRWIEGDIKRLRQEVNFPERKVKGELGLKKKRKLSELNERYRVKRKGLKTVIEELKKRVLAKSDKVRRYRQRIEQFRQNGIFGFVQKKMYTEFNGDGVRPSDVPNAEESKRFWGDIWSVAKGHNREAEWLKYIKIELGNDKHLQERVVISVEKVTKQCRKMPNLKAPRKDGVQGYWIKNFSNLHERVAAQTNKILMKDDSQLAWMTHGRTVLCQKDPR